MFFVIKRADHRGTRERDFVPMSVRFVIHRNVEWAMLMLGESVFSLLIVPAQHTLNFYVVFVTGCLTVSNVYVHHFVNYETGGLKLSPRGSTLALPALGQVSQSRLAQSINFDETHAEGIISPNAPCTEPSTPLLCDSNKHTGP